jgi:serine/threonine-protein phosphatase PP1-1
MTVSGTGSGKLDTKFSIFSAVPDDQRHIPGGRRGAGDYFL